MELRKTLNADQIIITDSSVLINFLQINRLDLLQSYPGNFYITEHVDTEITDEVQRDRMKEGIAQGILTVINVNQDNELVMYGRMMDEHRLGSGESSAIACAINRGFVLAVDDVAARKQALKVDSSLKIVGTQDIMIGLVQEDLLDGDEADLIKQTWEKQYRFTMKISTFMEI